MGTAQQDKQLWRTFLWDTGTFLGHSLIYSIKKVTLKRFCSHPINRSYTYRFVLLPETIGSIAYLTKRQDLLKKNVVCGYNLTCVGDERSYSHGESRYGRNLADLALKAALVNLESVFHYSFLDRGSDERQYCAPGVDLPVCTFCRSKLVVETFEHSTKRTNKSKFIKVSKVVKPTNKKTLL